MCRERLRLARGTASGSRPTSQHPESNLTRWDWDSSNGDLVSPDAARRGLEPLTPCTHVTPPELGAYQLALNSEVRGGVAQAVRVEGAGARLGYVTDRPSAAGAVWGMLERSFWPLTTIAKVAGKDLTVASLERAGYRPRNATVPRGPRHRFRSAPARPTRSAPASSSPTTRPRMCWTSPTRPPRRNPRSPGGSLTHCSEPSLRFRPCLRTLPSKP